jgi:uncharacterized protein YqeY
MSTKGRLQEDMKNAMRAGDKARLGVIRLALAAIKQVEVDDRTTLDDAAIQGLLQKMVKQRRESIEQFRAGGREDLVSQEEAEIQVITHYLPEPLTPDALARIVDDVVTETGASAMKDMGRVMAAIKARAAGGVDMSAVSALVKERLSP